MAFRLQTSAPELMDLKSETQATLDMYGVDPAKPSFARRACWRDAWSSAACASSTSTTKAGTRTAIWWAITRRIAATRISGSAALVKDLRQRGLLDETLVVWGGEFGRTPMVESNDALGRSLGRDHHPQAFTMWLAGGGIKPGYSYGRTDELGFNVVENQVHVHDLQATILNQLGLDHERLTFRYAGRDFRLTDVHGHVVREILA